MTNLLLLERMSKMNYVSLQQRFNRIPLLRYHYLGSVSPNYVPLLDNYKFVILNTQPSNIQCEHCKMIAHSRHKYLFCRLSLSTQIFQAAKRADDTRAPTIPLHPLRFPQAKCSFSSFRIPTRRNNLSS